MKIEKKLSLDTAVDRSEHAKKTAPAPQYGGTRKDTSFDVRQLTSHRMRAGRKAGTHPAEKDSESQKRGEQR